LEIDGLDHVVLTVADVETTCAFYERVLGMRVVRAADGRTALHFGAQKINLHQAGREFEPKARQPVPGAGDLCFLTATPIAAVLADLRDQTVEVELGPVQRDGATGQLTSVYFRDPDGNLLEVANSAA